MKVKKTLPIIMFCLGAAALIFALYATISPMIRSRVNPFEVDASEKITVEQDADGDWAFSGKLKNYSDREQSIIYLSVEVKDKSGEGAIIYIVDNRDAEDIQERVTLAPGEEFDIGEYYFEGYYRAPIKVVEVNVTLEEGFLNLKLQSSGDDRKIAMFLAYVLAVTFVVIGIGNLRYNRKVAARWNSMTENAANAETAGVYMVGYFGEGKISAKSFGKTFLSSLKAAFTSIFVGAGAYRNYMAGSKKDIVVTDGGIYLGNYSDKAAATLEGMRYVSKEDLGAYSVKTKKNQVDLFIADNNKISVNTMDNALDVGVIAEKLSKLINDDVSSESRSDISDGNGETL